VLYELRPEPQRREITVQETPFERGQRLRAEREQAQAELRRLDAQGRILVLVLFVLTVRSIAAFIDDERIGQSIFTLAVLGSLALWVGHAICDRLRRRGARPH
jgi:hypothetical protein